MSADPGENLEAQIARRVRHELEVVRLAVPIWIVDGPTTAWSAGRSMPSFASARHDRTVSPRVMRIRIEGRNVWMLMNRNR